MDAIPERPSIPPEPIAEGTDLGQGAYGKVSAMEVAGKMRAVKIGNFGPLESRIAALASKYLPKFISFTPMGGLEGRLVMSLAPRKLEKAPTEALPVAIRLCEALHDVGERLGQPIVHGDIKEGNIVLKANGEVKLIDWGCATPVGTMPTIGHDEYGEEKVLVRGTPGYAPPEAYGDAIPITSKFDSWAIGMTMYKLLSEGKSPFTGPLDAGTATAMLLISPTSKVRFEKTIEDLPRAPGVPEKVYTIMAMLLEIDPEKRLTPDQACILLKELSKPAVISAPGSSPTHVSASTSPSTSPPALAPARVRVRRDGSKPKGGSPGEAPPKVPKKWTKAPTAAAAAAPIPHSGSTIKRDTTQFPSLKGSKSVDALLVESERVVDFAASFLSPSEGEGVKLPRI